MDVERGRQHAIPAGRDAGFTLVEAVIAVGMLATLAAGVAQVFWFSTRAIHVARVRTFAAVLAAEKMEQLRSLTWAHQPGGALLSDTTTNLSADPPSSGGPGLAGSPLGSLDADTAFYVDYASAAGARVGAPGAAAYIRRWSVTPLPSDPDNQLMLQVRVLTVGGGDWRLASIKARRP
jgi:type II secretory pathway pseudopilin PulG